MDRAFADRWPNSPDSSGVSFQHPFMLPHANAPVIECSVAYKDARGIANYRCDMLPGGVVNRPRQKNLGKMRLWLVLKLRSLSWQLMLWQSDQMMQQAARNLAKHPSLRTEPDTCTTVVRQTFPTTRPVPSKTSAPVADHPPGETRVAKMLSNTSRRILWLRDHLRG